MVCENIEDVIVGQVILYQYMQRIAYRCAHSLTKVNFEGYDETVFIVTMSTSYKTFYVNNNHILYFYKQLCTCSYLMYTSIVCIMGYKWE